MTSSTASVPASARPPKARIFDGWSIGALLIAALVLAPIVAVAWLALFPRENIWPHLLATSLPRYLENTAILMTAVGLGSACIGAGAAWLVTMTRFPLRRTLDVALLAPLAAPAYVSAYALVDFLEYAGPVQTGLRALFGWSSARDYWFPEIRSLEAACFVLTMALYPYVYLLCRASFREQSHCAIEVGRSLGCGPWGVFFRVALPMARPAIAAGAAIAMMEALADFGAVDFFAVQTLTRGVFSVWLDSYNAGGAAQIACVMLIFVLALVSIERAARARRRYHQASRTFRPIEPVRLRGWRAGLAMLFCAIPVLCGFVLPVGVMSARALGHLEVFADPVFWAAAGRTAALAGAAAVIATLAGLFLVYGARHSASPWTRRIAQASVLGYAAPGAVLAVGVLIPYAALDRAVDAFAREQFGVSTGLLITGSAAVLIYAYVVRFCAVPYGAIDGAFERITPSMHMAARALGETQAGALRRVHFPIIRGSMITAALLVFVDSVKELPATLMLRPFGFETLATTVHAAASLEDLEAAAAPALAIIVVGLAPVAILAGAMRRARIGD